MNTANSGIRVAHVNYTFVDGTKHIHALSDISLEVGRGEIVALVGPSGSGKSTLLRLCVGLLQPTEGAIHTTFGGKAAMIFQDFALFPWLSVEENIEFGLLMKNMDGKKREKIAREAITEIGLGGFEKVFPKSLSGGMRQRVGIARALAVEPELLLMDEPFSALDSITSDRLKHDLLDIWQKRRFAILIVVHTIADAVELADRIVVFSSHPGRVKKIFKNDLSRPRNMREKPAYDLIDAVTAEIDSTL